MNWLDYTERQRKKMPPETQIKLLRLHVRKWIAYLNDITYAPMIVQDFDKLIRLCRTHGYKRKRS